MIAEACLTGLAMCTLVLDVTIVEQNRFEVTGIAAWTVRWVTIFVKTAIQRGQHAGGDLTSNTCLAIEWKLTIHCS